MANSYSAIALTGVTTTVLDARGRLYISAIDDTGGYYHTEIYNRVSRDASALVGHTATYNSTGAKTVLPDNDSGIGGTITVETATTETRTWVSYYRYGIVTATASNLLTIAGPPLNGSGSATLEGLWYGERDRVVSMRHFIYGSFAESTVSTALWTLGKTKEIWDQGYGHLVRFRATAAELNAGTKPRINIIIGSGLEDAGASSTSSGAGVQLTGAGTIVTATDLQPERCVVEFDEQIEVKVTQYAASADDKYLTVYSEWVLESGSDPLPAVTWTLKDIPSLVGEYWAEMGITIDTGVSAWADQSGVGGVPWVQATGTDQPAYSATGWGDGGPCLTFDGISDFMTADGLAALIDGAAQAFTIMILWEPLAPAADDDMVLQFSGATADWEFYQASSKLKSVAKGDSGGYLIKTGTATIAAELRSIVYDTSVLNTYKDGTPDVVDEAWAIGAATLTGMTLGRYLGGSLYHNNMRVAHISFFTEALSDEVRAQAEAYILARRPLA